MMNMIWKEFRRWKSLEETWKQLNRGRFVWTNVLWEDVASMCQPRNGVLKRLGISMCTANQREPMFRKSILVIFFPFTKKSDQDLFIEFTLVWKKKYRLYNIATEVDVTTYAKTGLHLSVWRHFWDYLSFVFRTQITRWWITTRTPSETFSSALLEGKLVSKIYFSYMQYMLCLSHFALHNPFTQISVNFDNFYRVLREWSTRDLRRS